MDDFRLTEIMQSLPGKNELQPMGEDLWNRAGGSWRRQAPGRSGEVAPVFCIDRHHPAASLMLPSAQFPLFSSRSSSPAVAGVERLIIHSPNW